MTPKSRVIRGALQYAARNHPERPAARRHFVFHGRSLASRGGGTHDTRRGVYSAKGHHVFLTVQASYQFLYARARAAMHVAASLPNAAAFIAARHQLDGASIACAGNHHAHYAADLSGTGVADGGQRRYCNFSKGSIDWRWNQGYSDATRAIQQAKWLTEVKDRQSVIVHELDRTNE